MRSWPRMPRTLALAVPLALAVAACSGSGTGSAAGRSASPAAGRQVVVGATLPLTGSLAALGAPLRAGYEQEVADVNAAGGITIGGTKEQLRLVVLNDGSDPGTASSQASQLVRQDHAVALLGPATALTVTPVALVAEQLRIPFLTSLMPVEAFAAGDKDGWDYSWDAFADERQQADAAARALAAAPGDKKVALFSDDEPESVAERPLYEAAFKADGLDLVGDYTFAAGTANFSAYLAEARTHGAQLLAGDLTPQEGTALWKQAKAAGPRPQAAFLANASSDENPWWQSLGTLAQGILSPGYWTPSQASPGQLARISATLGKKYSASPVSYATAAMGYAVAEVLTDALAKAGSTAPGILNTAISQTNAPTTAGLIKFSQTTHTAITPASITRWHNGTLVLWPPAAR